MKEVERKLSTIMIEEHNTDMTQANDNVELLSTEIANTNFRKIAEETVGWIDTELKITEKVLKDCDEDSRIPDYILQSKSFYNDFALVKTKDQLLAVYAKHGTR